MISPWTFMLLLDHLLLHHSEVCTTSSTFPLQCIRQLQSTAVKLSCKKIPCPCRARSTKCTAGHSSIRSLTMLLSLQSKACVGQARVQWQRQICNVSTFADMRPLNSRPSLGQGKSSCMSNSCYGPALVDLKNLPISSSTCSPAA